MSVQYLFSVLECFRSSLNGSEHSKLYVFRAPDGANKVESTLAATAKATTIMNSKTIFHLLLVFSLFYSCLPAPKHFLVETEAKGKKDIGNKQVVGSFKILQNSL